MCNTIGYLIMGLLLLPRSQLAATPSHAVGVAVALLAIYLLSSDDDGSTEVPSMPSTTKGAVS